MTGLLLYIGPGLGSGTIITVLIILLIVAISVVYIIWIPIKNFFRKIFRRNNK